MAKIISEPKVPVQETLFHLGTTDVKGVILGENSIEAVARRKDIQKHMGILKSMGIDSLSDLGKMTISGNVMMPSGGFVSKRAPASTATTVPFSYARKWDPKNSEWAFISSGRPGIATLLASEPLKGILDVIPGTDKLTADMFLNVCYLAADEIDIAAGANIILQNPQQHLVVLVNKLTVGANVTLTYERASGSLPPKPQKPGKPGTPDPPVPPPFREGFRGTDGARGENGGTGARYNTAPQVEVWLLEINRSFAVDLQGQNGGQGGPGGDGGDGGNGSAGSRAIGNDITCKSGPGDGGDGGNGGRAGDGGPGGVGAPGGQFLLFAPDPMFHIFTSGFNISTSPGTGGTGGIPGIPGNGGEGGPVGFKGPRACWPKFKDRSAGEHGAQGGAGVQGANGPAGAQSVTYPIKFILITPDEFTAALLKPAVINLSKSYAKEGETVSIVGKNLTATDKVMMKGQVGNAVACTTTMFPSIAASFVVPAVPGGPCDVYIRQADGTESNRGTLYIMPTLNSIENGPRVKPGATVKIYGTGLSPGTRVLINGLDICPSSAFVDAHTLKVTIVRPLNLPPDPKNAGGEPVLLGVTLQDLDPIHGRSNTIPIVLDTYRMLVFGDSTMWGNGLRDENKFHALVQAKVRSGNSNIGVYRTVAAHNGAIIGNGDTHTEPDKHQEVPTKYPTILQQVDRLAGLPDAQHVDLVLVDGGINDVQLKVIFNWMTTPKTIVNRVEQYCHKDMHFLLNKIASAFPNARIIVTGYFAPIAKGSNDQPWEHLFLSCIAVFGFEILPDEGLDWHLEVVKEHSKLFADHANIALAQAVAETNTNLGGTPRVFFADPKFGQDNGVFCSDPWLWGLNQDLSPEDELAGERAGLCEQQADKVQFCKKSSLGHPNVKGARMYAEAIYPLLG